jgi:hypothetical protein
MKLIRMLEQRQYGHHPDMLSAMDLDIEKSRDVYRFQQFLEMDYYDLEVRRENAHHDVVLVFVNHIRHTEKIVKHLRFILTDRDGYYFWNSSDVHWEDIQVATSLEECTKERFYSIVDDAFIKNCFTPSNFLSTLFRFFSFIMT